MARTHRIPTFRSAIWNGTWRPNSVTPVPNGITAKARNAGIMAMTGARRYTGRSARVGVIPSLKNSLIPSARVISTPRGPARIGPDAGELPVDDLALGGVVRMDLEERFLLQRGLQLRGPLGQAALVHQEGVGEQRQVVEPLGPVRVHPGRGSLGRLPGVEEP